MRIERIPLRTSRQERIPMATLDDQPTTQEENAKAKGDEQFWNMMRDLSAAKLESHKRIIAKLESKIAEESP